MPAASRPKNITRKPTVHIVRFLEEAAGWALLMAVLSGIVMGAAIAAVLFGQLSCGGG
jgi:hypothetical protein